LLFRDDGFAAFGRVRAFGAGRLAEAIFAAPFFDCAFDLAAGFEPFFAAEPVFFLFAGFAI
jgi:hypothetical protein